MFTDWKIISKLLHNFSTIPIKISVRISVDRGKITLKFIGEGEEIRLAETTVVERTNLLNSKIYYVASIIILYSSDGETDKKTDETQQRTLKQTCTSTTN